MSLLRKFSLGLPWEMYEELQKIALQQKMSLTDVIRGRILQAQNSSVNTNSLDQILSLLQLIHQKLTEQKEPNSTQAISSENQSSDPLLLEILFLLREFLFERNGQVLRRVDEKLDRHFGKDRKKVL